MKIVHFSTLFAVLPCLGMAAVIPVSEDTYVPVNNVINKTVGKAATLRIAQGKAALLRFDIAGFSGLIPTSTVSSARLVFQVSAVAQPGNLTLHRITTEWSESPAGNRTPPAYDGEVLTLVPSNRVVQDQFLMLDVTDQVKEWLASPGTDFGLALVGVGNANCQIASKEGPTNGHAAWIEIESQAVIGNDAIAPGLDVAKLGNGAVNNTEFSYLAGVINPLQGQLDAVDSLIEDLDGSVSELQGEVEEMIESLATLSSTVSGKVSKSGDTMTGALILPANGLTVGTDQMVVADGKTGLGTATPGGKLDVRGDIRLGSTGQYYVPGGEENLKLLRGGVVLENSIPKVGRGEGFTVSSVTSKIYQITFDTPFSDVPTIVAHSGGATTVSVPGILSVSAEGFRFDGLSAADYEFKFIAVGTR